MLDAMRFVILTSPSLESAFRTCIIIERSLYMHQLLELLRYTLLASFIADQGVVQVQSVTSFSNVPLQLRIREEESIRGTERVLTSFIRCQYCLEKQNTILRELLNYFLCVLFDFLFIIILYTRSFYL